MTDPKDYDDVTIVCFRVGERVLVVDGASKTKCEGCAMDVWIAPSSRRIRAENKHARVVCAQCAAKRLVSREQLDEIEGTLENRKRRN